ASKYQSQRVIGSDVIEHRITLNDNSGKMDIYIELNWQGHYNEPMYTVRMPLKDSTKDLHLFYNPKRGVWREE
ncbi:unnamed protein product, partial [Rotaria magnacalcarata]